MSKERVLIELRFLSYERIGVISVLRIFGFQRLRIGNSVVWTRQ